MAFDALTASERPTLFRLERVPTVDELAPSRSAVRALVQQLIENYARATK